MPVTKHNEMVHDADRIPGAIAEAFHIASTGRKGPVLIDIPKDVLAQELTEFVWPDKVVLPGYKPNVKGHSKMVREAIDVILAAEKPVIYAGGGIVASGAEAQLLSFAETLDLPVVTTLMARGAFPDSHANHLGMPGMHGHWPAVTALQQADLLIGLGTRFDDRVTGKLDAVRAKCQGRPRRHRPGRDREEQGGRRADRRRPLHRHGTAEPRCSRSGESPARDPGGSGALVGNPRTLPRRAPTVPRAGSRRAAEAQTVVKALNEARARGLHHRHRRRPAPDVGQPAGVL